MTTASRRAVLTGALGLAACGAGAPAPQVPPLKSVFPVPLGVAAMTGQLDDFAWTETAARHFDRLTPEWELKPERCVRPDGGFDFAAADRLAAFARARGMTLHGHTLVWYHDQPAPWRALEGDRAALGRAVDGWIAAAVGRYRGLAPGWDVVNEAVRDDGSGLRDCLYLRAFGEGYVARAFAAARAADPDATLFLNDYDLEVRPDKRRAFLALAERLLKAGAPLTGLGTQAHLNADLPPGAAAAAIRDLAALGLPVHVSELDVSLNRAEGAWTRRDALRRAQVRIVEETVEALLALPAAQRWGLTVWGLRDADSWLRRGAEDRGPFRDEPLLFDDAARPKPAAAALVGAAARARGA